MTQTSQWVLTAYSRLFAAFCLLVTFRFCYQRLCFRLLDKIGVNFVFIFYCLAFIIGITSFPAILCRLNIEGNSRRAAFQVLVLSAVLPTALGYFTGEAASVVCQFFSMALVAGGIGMCLNHAAVMGLAPLRAGRFVGYAFAAKALSGAILFFLPGVEIPNGAIEVILCIALLAAAALFPICGDGSREPDERVAANVIPVPAVTLPPRRIALLAGGVICVYAIVAGLLDSIYFFDSAFDNIPHFMFFILIYDSAVYAIAGCVADKYRWSASASISFLLICAGQSMSFFSHHELLVYPYTVFSDAGNITLEVLTVTLPLIWCSMAEKPGRRGIMAGFGFVAFYGGMMAGSILFAFISASMYKMVLGTALLASLAAVCFIISLSEAYEKFHRERVAAPNAPAAKNYLDMYGFSAKEREVVEYLMTGASTKEIAARMFISERTVNYHVGSMLKKSGCRNRVELITRLKG
jgi:DNA-binding CsgD family transcriptional regulator